MTETLITIEPDAMPGSRLSEAVVEAVADAEGVSPLELRPPLFEVVDPDALDKLFPLPSLEQGRTEGHVTFEYCGYEVTVQPDGVISVGDLQE